MKRYLTLCLLIAALGAGAQTLTRKAVFTPGQQFERSITVSLDMEMKIFGKSEMVGNSGSSIAAITVLKVLDTAYHFDVRFVHKTQKTTSSSKNYEFDSRQPADTAYPAEWAKFIKPIGEANQVVLNKLGYIISRTDSTESDGGVAGMIPDMNPGATSKRKTYDLVAHLPAGPVKVGDTWTDSTITEKTKEYSRSTLESLTASEARINYTDSLLIEMEMDTEGRKMKIKLEVKTSGVARFDPRTGVVMKKEENMNASGTFGMQGFNLPVIFKGETITSFKVKKP